MYKLICSNLSRTHRSLTSFTTVCKKVAQNYDTQRSPERTENSFDSESNLLYNAEQKQEQSAETIKGSSNRTISYNSFFIKRPLLDVKKSSHSIRSISHSPAPARYLYSSLVDQSNPAKESAVSKKKAFKNKEAIEMYKNAIVQCKKIQIDKYRTNSIYKSSNWYPRPLEPGYSWEENEKTDANKEEIVVMDDPQNTKPAAKPQPKRVVHVFQERSPTTLPRSKEVERISMKRAAHQFTNKKVRIKYPTHTVNYKIGLNKPYYLDQLISNQTDKLTYEEITRARNKVKGVSPAEALQMKYKSQQPLALLMKGATDHNPQWRKRKADDKAEDKSLTKPSVKRARMAISSNYNKLMSKIFLKSQENAEANRASEVAVEEENAIKEVARAKVVKPLKKSRELTIEPTIMQHPMRVQKEENLDTALKYRKRILIDKPENYNIEATCIKNNVTHPNHVSQKAETIEKIKIVETIKKPTKQLGKLLATVDPVEKKLEENVAKESPKLTAGENKSETAQRSVERHPTAAETLAEYLEQLKQLKDQTALDRSSIMKAVVTDKPDAVRKPIGQRVEILGETVKTDVARRVEEQRARQVDVAKKIEEQRSKGKEKVNVEEQTIKAAEESDMLLAQNAAQKETTETVEKRKAKEAEEKNVDEQRIKEAEKKNKLEKQNMWQDIIKAADEQKIDQKEVMKAAAVPQTAVKEAIKIFEEQRTSQKEKIKPTEEGPSQQEPAKTLEELRTWQEDAKKSEQALQGERQKKSDEQRSVQVQATREAEVQTVREAQVAEKLKKSKIAQPVLEKKVGKQVTVQMEPPRQIQDQVIKQMEQPKIKQLILPQKTEKQTMEQAEQARKCEEQILRQIEAAKKLEEQRTRRAEAVKKYERYLAKQEEAAKKIEQRIRQGVVAEQTNVGFQKQKEIKKRRSHAATDPHSCQTTVLRKNENITNKLSEDNKSNVTVPRIVEKTTEEPTDAKKITSKLDNLNIVKVLEKLDNVKSSFYKKKTSKQEKKVAAKTTYLEPQPRKDQQATIKLPPPRPENKTTKQQLNVVNQKEATTTNRIAKPKTTSEKIKTDILKKSVDNLKKIMSQYKVTQKDVQTIQSDPNTLRSEVKLSQGEIKRINKRKRRQQEQHKKIEKEEVKKPVKKHKYQLSEEEITKAAPVKPKLEQTRKTPHKERNLEKFQYCLENHNPATLPKKVTEEDLGAKKSNAKKLTQKKKVAQQPEQVKEAPVEEINPEKMLEGTKPNSIKGVDVEGLEKILKVDKATSQLEPATKATSNEHTIIQEDKQETVAMDEELNTELEQKHTETKNQSLDGFEKRAVRRNYAKLKEAGLNIVKPIPGKVKEKSEDLEDGVEKTATSDEIRNKKEKDDEQAIKMLQTAVRRVFEEGRSDVEEKSTAREDLESGLKEDMTSLRKDFMRKKPSKQTVETTSKDAKQLEELQNEELEIPKPDSLKKAKPEETLEDVSGDEMLNVKSKHTPIKDEEGRAQSTENASIFDEQTVDHAFSKIKSRAKKALGPSHKPTSEPPPERKESPNTPKISAKEVEDTDNAPLEYRPVIRQEKPDADHKDKKEKAKRKRSIVFPPKDKTEQPKLHNSGLISGDLIKGNSKRVMICSSPDKVEVIVLDNPGCKSLTELAEEQKSEMLDEINKKLEVKSDTDLLRRVKTGNVKKSAEVSKEITKTSAENLKKEPLTADTKKGKDESIEATDSTKLVENKNDEMNTTPKALEVKEEVKVSPEIKQPAKRETFIVGGVRRKKGKLHIKCEGKKLTNKCAELAEKHKQKLKTEPRIQTGIAHINQKLTLISKDVNNQDEGEKVSEKDQRNTQRIEVGWKQPRHVDTKEISETLRKDSKDVLGFRSAQQPEECYQKTQNLQKEPRSLDKGNEILKTSAKDLNLGDSSQKSPTDLKEDQSKCGEGCFPYLNKRKYAKEYGKDNKQTIPSDEGIPEAKVVKSKATKRLTVMIKLPQYDIDAEGASTAKVETKVKQATTSPAAPKSCLDECFSQLKHKHPKDDCCVKAKAEEKARDCPHTREAAKTQCFSPTEEDKPEAKIANSKPTERLTVMIKLPQYDIDAESASTAKAETKMKEATTSPVGPKSCLDECISQLKHKHPKDDCCVKSKAEEKPRDCRHTHEAAKTQCFPPTEEDKPEAKVVNSKPAERLTVMIKLPQYDIDAEGASTAKVETKMKEAPKSCLDEYSQLKHKHPRDDCCVKPKAEEKPRDCRHTHEAAITQCVPPTMEKKASDAKPSSSEKPCGGGKSATASGAGSGSGGSKPAGTGTEIPKLSVKLTSPKTEKSSEATVVQAVQSKETKSSPELTAIKEKKSEEKAAEKPGKKNKVIIQLSRDPTMLVLHRIYARNDITKSSCVNTAKRSDRPSSAAEKVERVGRPAHPPQPTNVSVVKSNIKRPNLEYGITNANIATEVLFSSSDNKKMKSKPVPTKLISLQPIAKPSDTFTSSDNKKTKSKPVPTKLTSLQPVVEPSDRHLDELLECEKRNLEKQFISSRKIDIKDDGGKEESLQVRIPDADSLIRDVKTGPEKTTEKQLLKDEEKETVVSVESKSDSNKSRVVEEKEPKEPKIYSRGETKASMLYKQKNAESKLDTTNMLYSSKKQKRQNIYGGRKKPPKKASTTTKRLPKNSDGEKVFLVTVQSLDGLELKKEVVKRPEPMTAFSKVILDEVIKNTILHPSTKPARIECNRKTLLPMEKISKVALLPSLDVKSLNYGLIPFTFTRHRDEEAEDKIKELRLPPIKIKDQSKGNQGEEKHVRKSKPQPETKYLPKEAKMVEMDTSAVEKIQSCDQFRRYYKHVEKTRSLNLIRPSDNQLEKYFYKYLMDDQLRSNFSTYLLDKRYFRRKEKLGNESEKTIQGTDEVVRPSKSEPLLRPENQTQIFYRKYLLDDQLRRIFTECLEGSPYFEKRDGSGPSKCKCLLENQLRYLKKPNVERKEKVGNSQAEKLSWENTEAVKSSKSETSVPRENQVQIFYRKYLLDDQLRNIFSKSLGNSEYFKKKEVKDPCRHKYLLDNELKVEFSKFLTDKRYIKEPDNEAQYTISDRRYLLQDDLIPNGPSLGQRTYLQETQLLPSKLTDEPKELAPVIADEIQANFDITQEAPQIFRKTSEGQMERAKDKKHKTTLRYHRRSYYDLIAFMNRFRTFSKKESDSKNR